MMETDDKMIRHFFEDNKKEIADRGFSRKVMQSLPKERRVAFKICTLIITLLAFVLFIMYDGFLGLIYIFRDIFVSIAQSSDLYTNPKSIIIAVVVLLILGIKKVISLE